MDKFNIYNTNPTLIKNIQGGTFNDTYFSITEVNSTLNFGTYITYSGTQISTDERVIVSSLLVSGTSTITGDLYLNGSGTYTISDYTWTSRTTNTNSWRQVIWVKELSLFVAVGATGSTNRVMTSPDGITWTTRTTVANSWQALTWSPELSLLVAVGFSGSNNRAMTSPDGITWTTRTTNSNNWATVIWVKELSLFVATAFSGSGDRVMTSPDGINWTTRTTNDNQWYSVAWSPELSLLVATSITGTNDRIMTSPDGITWTTRPTNNNNWRNITWSPEKHLFVAVAVTGTNRVMTSYDGINWTLGSTPEDNNWYSVTWAKEVGLFIAVSDNGTNRVMISEDGFNWEVKPAAIANQWYSVVWSPELSRFVSTAYGGGSNRVMTWDIPKGSYLLVNSNTKIGIGTTNPTEQLHVIGDTRMEGNLIIMSGTNYTEFVDGKIGINTYPQFSVDVNGDTNANSYFKPSDQRIKKDFQEYQVSSLPDIYQYSYIKNNKMDIGFIAQYLQETHPDVIKRITDFIPNINSYFNSSGEYIYNINDNLTVGDKLLITSNNIEKEYTIIEIGKDFIRVNEELNSSIVYVYGKKVTDFCVIDRDYLFTLNFGMNLELLKKINELEQKSK